MKSIVQPEMFYHRPWLRLKLLHNTGHPDVVIILLYDVLLPYLSAFY